MERLHFRCFILIQLPSLSFVHFFKMNIHDFEIILLIFSFGAKGYLLLSYLNISFHWKLFDNFNKPAEKERKSEKEKKTQIFASLLYKYVLFVIIYFFIFKALSSGKKYLI